MPQRRQMIIAGAVTLAALGVYWLLQPRPVLVETAPVVEDRFIVTIEEDGRTRVRDRYIVSAPLSGRVPRLPLRVGDTVKAGQVLLSLEPQAAPLLDQRARRELEERLGAAEAAVEEAGALEERARVLLARAQTDLDRTTQLKARGVAATAQLERDTFTFQSAERELAAAGRRRHAAEHALDQAKAALRRSADTGTTERFPIKAPIDGRVLKVAQESAAVVPLGSPLLELGDLGDLEVVVDVLTAEAATVREGGRVWLERWGGPNTLEARVRRVEPSGFTKISALGVEEQRVWIVCDIVSPRAQWESLGDGFRVDVRIVVEELQRAVVVPVGALFRRGETWNVFLAERGVARLRAVDVARRSGRLAAIAKGVTAGEKVVLFPSTSLKDGTAVRQQ